MTEEDTCMTEEIDDMTLLEQYQASGQLPLFWQLTARQFVCAANILRSKCKDDNFFAAKEPNYNNLWKPHRAVRLLYGLALENLLKGLLVAQGVDATSTGKLNNELKTHNLAHLWKLASLPLTDQEEEILKILHWAIETNKYPVGLKHDAVTPNVFNVANVTANVHRIVALVETVENALREIQSEA